MSQFRNFILPRITEAYSAYYDINKMDGSTSLFARCDYHSRNSQYVLVKRAEIWASENHEYLYLHTVDTATTDVVSAIMDSTLADGEPRIVPHKTHMYTHLSAVIVCDSMSPDVVPLLKKMKKHRDYRLSLHGWMEFKIAVVDLSTGKIYTNPKGSQLAKDLAGFVEKQIKIFEKKGEE